MRARSYLRGSTDNPFVNDVGQAFQLWPLGHSHQKLQTHPPFPHSCRTHPALNPHSQNGSQGPYPCKNLASEDRPWPQNIKKLAFGSANDVLGQGLHNLSRRKMKDGWIDSRPVDLINQITTTWTAWSNNLKGFRRCPAWRYLVQTHVTEMWLRNAQTQRKPMCFSRFQIGAASFPIIIASASWGQFLLKPFRFTGNYR